MDNPVKLFLVVVGAYIAVGVLVALWFVFRAVAKRDPAAAATPLRVRLLFLPGATAVWPALLARPNPRPAALRGDTHDAIIRRHAITWITLTPVLLLTLILLLTLRPAPITAPGEHAVLLDPDAADRVAERAAETDP